MHKRKKIVISAVIILLICLSSIYAMYSQSNDIFEAARKGKKKDVESFLEKDPDLVSAKDENGNTPLHFAVYNGKDEIVELLILKNAAIDVLNHSGSAPLHMAVIRRDRRIIELLCDKGADIEVKNAYGRTPLLMVARDIGDENLARMLIEAGSDINAIDNYNETPIVLTAWRGNEKLVNLFLDNGADIPVAGENSKKLLIYSADKNLERLFIALNEKRADLTIRNNTGGTLLHSAAAGGSMDIIDMLLEKGFKISEPDRYGWTPLHYSSDNKQKKAAELLISKGAELNIKTISGKTAYNIADEKDYGDIAGLLKRNGAELSPRDFPILTGEYLGLRKPGSEPEIFAKDIVSTNKFQHGSLTFSPDGKELFWSSSYKVRDSGHTVGQIYSMKIDDDRWTAPQPASFTVDHDDVPFFSPDGNRIYFLSQRSGPENIWFVERTGTGWSDPKPTDPAVNQLGMHWQISISSNNTIYFNSGHNSGFGMGDIYASKKENGHYSKPENLGNTINTEFVDMCPFIAPDESYMIFSSDRSEGFGRTDLYISFKNEHGEWTEPVNLGSTINTSSSEICPIVSPDNKYLFFNSQRAGNSDIYWVNAEIIESLKPEGIR
ncbi:ankyrin repeat domain-containing protein [candidate division KSB1 bacterium]